MSQFLFHVANIIEEGKLGGPQIRICTVAKALQEQVETTVIMPETNSQEFRRKCDDNNIRYKVFHISRITKELQVALRYLLFSPIEVLMLSYYFKKNDYALIHVSGGSWQYKGVIAGKLAGRKVIWHLNDTAMPWLIRTLFSILSRYCDCYIYASERTKAYYSDLISCRKPEFVIPAPVNTDHFNPTCSYPGDEELINEWQGKTVIGTVANINPIKGLETFILAIEQLNKERKEEFKFVVIGPVFKRQKSYFSRLTSLCKNLGVDNIEFVGGRRDVRPLLARFDIYCCSSLAESSPISVWEAMAMGKPVVSTDVGDVPLNVKDGENGFIVDVGDSVKMAKRLNLLSENDELRSTFSRRSRDVAVRELDVSGCAEKHLAAYTSILT